MTTFLQRLHWLRGQKADAANQALIDALGHAEPSEVAPLIEALLDRPNQAAYRLIVQRFHQLPHDLREVLRHSDGRLSLVLGKTLHSGSLQERQNALELVAARRDMRCIGALGTLVGGIEKELSQPAAETLLDIIRYHTGSGRGFALTEMEREHIDTVITDTIDRFPEHRQPSVLLAGALLSRNPGPRLAAWLADGGHPSHLAARGVLKHFSEEVLAGHLLEWLNIESLVSQALPQLDRLASTPALGMILSQAHLLCLPTVNRRLQRLDSRRPSTISAESALSDLTPEQQRSFPAWIRSIPMQEANRVEKLGVGLSFTDTRARLASLRQLIDLDSSAADQSALSFCFDPNESIARLATRHTVRRRPAGTIEVLRRLHLSAHASVRHLAAEAGRRVEFQDVWKIWSDADRRPTPLERHQARELASTNQSRFVRELRRYLRCDSRSHVLAAIQMSTDMNLLLPLELDLLTMVGHSDDRVVATVVSSLGRIQSPASKETLQAALGHSEARVRANALDALYRRAAIEDTPKIEQFTQAQENRVRANAIRTMLPLDRPRAASMLEEMLNDTRPMHRISALWVVGRDRTVECARAVADMAIRDPSKPVRTRAKQTAGRLLASMAHRQSNPPTRVESPEPMDETASIKTVIEPTAHSMNVA